MYSRPNSVINGDGFHISYNAVDIGIYGSDTTALVTGQMERFYILNGDHRAAFRGILDGGLEACMDYVRANVDGMNHRSDKLVAVAA